MYVKLGEFDVLVMPSYNEGQPIVALEAMSASIPVIGSDVGGMSQLIDDTLVAEDGEHIQRCGILTQAADPEGFAEALKMVMDSPEYYEQLCINARERVIKFFQLHDVMQQYNLIYRTLGGLELKPEQEDMKVMSVKSVTPPGLAEHRRAVIEKASSAGNTATSDAESVAQSMTAMQEEMTPNDPTRGRKHMFRETAR